MSDGSNMGITAGRALGTILGGEGQPIDEEKATPEQVRERIMNAPYPCEGEPIWKRYKYVNEAYSVATDCIAKAFLLAEEAEPGILDKRGTYPDDYEVGSLRGVEYSSEHFVWEWVMNNWPKFDDWIGGASGFMVGFAYNTARYINEQAPVPNPAIMEIKIKLPPEAHGMGLDTGSEV